MPERPSFLKEVSPKKAGYFAIGIGVLTVLISPGVGAIIIGGGAIAVVSDKK